MHVHIQPCGQVQAVTYGVDTPVTRAARQHLASRMTKLSSSAWFGLRTYPNDLRVRLDAGSAASVRCNLTRPAQSFVTGVRPSRNVVVAASGPGGRKASP